VGAAAPLASLCARIAAAVLTRVLPTAAAVGAASTGLSAPGSAGGTQLAVRGGRLGGAVHRARVAQVADELADAGLRITAGGGRLPERAVQVGGGRIRFPDIIAEAADASRVFVNVGKVTKTGEPVAREVRALEDLRRTGIPGLFVPYNRP
jgi:hypothetical protein